MLRSFRVANHRSIRDEQELLLMPAYGERKSSRDVTVPVAAVYGANASGKSNLLSALGWLQAAVRNSFSSWENETGVPRRSFRLDPQRAQDPTLFTVEIVVTEGRFTYGLSTDDDQILEEWLYWYPENRKRVVFEREGLDLRLGSTVVDHKSRAVVLKQLLRDNALLLSTAAQANLSEVAPVYRWFRHGLKTSSRPTAHGWTIGSRRVRRVERALEAYPTFLELVRVADLGITDIRIDSEAIPLEAIAEVLNSERPEGRRRIHDTMWTSVAGRRSRTTAQMSAAEVQQILGKAGRLQFVHGAEAVPLAEAEQSDGTLAWMDLVLDTLETLEHGGVLTVDEFDASLHPRLTARLIELYRDERSNPHGSQLIFTTHDASLLGTSFGSEILARDEIWFVEKDSQGATVLFPLTDFHPRSDENRERRYLGGSYGAVPAVFSDTMVEGFLSSRKGGHEGSS